MNRPALHQDGDKKRDSEEGCSTDSFGAELRRLADDLEAGKQFKIQITIERVNSHVRTEYNA